MSNSTDSLQEYLDSLFNDTSVSERHGVADGSHVTDERHMANRPSRLIDEQSHVIDEQSNRTEATLKLAAGSNIAPLSTASRSLRAISSRAYAEPVRTLNLRMPLPSVAAEAKPTTETKSLETKSAIENKLTTETKVSVKTSAPVETKAPAQTKATAETEPPKEINSIGESTTVAEAPALEEIAPSRNGSQDELSAALSTMTAPAAWLSNGRPQWAQQPFECLIFKAGGLQLAAPLVELGSIYPLDQNALTEIFGQAQEFIGLLPTREYNVRMMDTGLVIMPERYTPSMREDYRYVVSLFGSDWGLAIDVVIGTAMLDPDRVRWRGERSKRPWLAGTLIDQMCALFDIAQLAWFFHHQDRKRSVR